MKVNYGDIVVYEWENGHRVSIIYNKFINLEDLTSVIAIIPKDEINKYKVGE